MRDRTVARVRLGNIVWDARDPRRLGRSGAAAVGADLITDEPDAVEARLRLTDEFFLDLCFQRVAALSPSPSRLQLVDAEGNPLRVPGDTGPFAALRFDSADPAGRPTHCAPRTSTAHPADTVRSRPQGCEDRRGTAPRPRLRPSRRAGPACGGALTPRLLRRETRHLRRP
jgi:hypothetical protein